MTENAESRSIDDILDEQGYDDEGKDWIVKEMINRGFFDDDWTEDDVLDFIEQLEEEEKSNPKVKTREDFSIKKAKDRLNDPNLKTYWLSWWNTEGYSPFTLAFPWWVSGERFDGVCICAAIKASSIDDAKAFIIDSYDKPPSDVEWRFVNECSIFKFNDRFARDSWMVWN